MRLAFPICPTDQEPRPELDHVLAEGSVHRWSADPPDCPLV